MYGQGSASSDEAGSTRKLGEALRRKDQQNAELLDRIITLETEVAKRSVTVQEAEVKADLSERDAARLSTSNEKLRKASPGDYDLDDDAVEGATVDALRAKNAVLRAALADVSQRLAAAAARSGAGGDGAEAATGAVAAALHAAEVDGLRAQVERLEEPRAAADASPAVEASAAYQRVAAELKAHRAKCASLEASFAAVSSKAVEAAAHARAAEAKLAEALAETAALAADRKLAQAELADLRSKANPAAAPDASQPLRMELEVLGAENTALSRGLAVAEKQKATLREEVAAIAARFAVVAVETKALRAQNVANEAGFDALVAKQGPDGAEDAWKVRYETLKEEMHRHSAVKSDGAAEKHLADVTDKLLAADAEIENLRGKLVASVVSSPQSDVRSPTFAVTVTGEDHHNADRDVQLVMSQSVARTSFRLGEAEAERKNLLARLTQLQTSQTSFYSDDEDTAYEASLCFPTRPNLTARSNVVLEGTSASFVLPQLDPTEQAEELSHEIGGMRVKGRDLEAGIADLRRLLAEARADKDVVKDQLLATRKELKRSVRGGSAALGTSTASSVGGNVAAELSDLRRQLDESSWALQTAENEVTRLKQEMEIADFEWKRRVEESEAKAEGANGRIGALEAERAELELRAKSAESERDAALASAAAAGDSRFKDADGRTDLTRLLAMAEDERFEDAQRRDSEALSIEKLSQKASTLEDVHSVLELKQRLYIAEAENKELTDQILMMQRRKSTSDAPMSLQFGTVSSLAPHTSRNDFLTSFSHTDFDHTALTLPVDPSEVEGLRKQRNELQASVATLTQKLNEASTTTARQASISRETSNMSPTTDNVEQLRRKNSELETLVKHLKRQLDEARFELRNTGTLDSSKVSILQLEEPADISSPIVLSGSGRTSPRRRLQQRNFNDSQLSASRGQSDARRFRGAESSSALPANYINLREPSAPLATVFEFSNEEVNDLRSRSGALQSHLDRVTGLLTAAEEEAGHAASPEIELDILRGTLASLGDIRREITMGSAYSSMQRYDMSYRSNQSPAKPHDGTLASLADVRRVITLGASTMPPGASSSPSNGSDDYKSDGLHPESPSKPPADQRTPPRTFVGEPSVLGFSGNRPISAEKTESRVVLDPQEPDLPSPTWLGGGAGSARFGEEPRAVRSEISRNLIDPQEPDIPSPTWLGQKDGGTSPRPLHRKDISRNLIDPQEPDVPSPTWLGDKESTGFSSRQLNRGDISRNLMDPQEPDCPSPTWLGDRVSSGPSPRPLHRKDMSRNLINPQEPDLPSPTWLGERSGTFGRNTSSSAGNATQLKLSEPEPPSPTWLGQRGLSKGHGSVEVLCLEMPRELSPTVFEELNKAGLEALAREIWIKFVTAEAELYRLRGILDGAPMPTTYLTLNAPGGGFNEEVKSLFFELPNDVPDCHELVEKLRAALKAADAEVCRLREARGGAYTPTTYLTLNAPGGGYNEEMKSLFFELPNDVPGCHELAEKLRAALKAADAEVCRLRGLLDGAPIPTTYLTLNAPGGGYNDGMQSLFSELPTDVPGCHELAEKLRAALKAADAEVCRLRGLLDGARMPTTYLTLNAPEGGFNEEVKSLFFELPNDVPDCHELAEKLRAALKAADAEVCRLRGLLDGAPTPTTYLTLNAPGGGLFSEMPGDVRGCQALVEELRAALKAAEAQLAEKDKETRQLTLDNNALRKRINALQDAVRELTAAEPGSPGTDPAGDRLRNRLLALGDNLAQLKDHVHTEGEDGEELVPESPTRLNPLGTLRSLLAEDRAAGLVPKTKKDTVMDALICAEPSSPPKASMAAQTGFDDSTSDDGELMAALRSMINEETHFRQQIQFEGESDRMRWVMSNIRPSYVNELETVTRLLVATQEAEAFARFHHHPTVGSALRCIDAHSARDKARAQSGQGSPLTPGISVSASTMDLQAELAIARSRIDELNAELFNAKRRLGDSVPSDADDSEAANLRSTRKRFSLPDQLAGTIGAQEAHLDAKSLPSEQGDVFAADAEFSASSAPATPGAGKPNRKQYIEEIARLQSELAAAETRIEILEGAVRASAAGGGGSPLPTTTRVMHSDAGHAAEAELAAAEMQIEQLEATLASLSSAPGGSHATLQQQLSDAEARIAALLEQNKAQHVRMHNQTEELQDELSSVTAELADAKAQIAGGLDLDALLAANAQLKEARRDNDSLRAALQSVEAALKVTEGHFADLANELAGLVQGPKARVIQQKMNLIAQALRGEPVPEAEGTGDAPSGDALLRAVLHAKKKCKEAMSAAALLDPCDEALKVSDLLDEVHACLESEAGPAAGAGESGDGEGGKGSDIDALKERIRTLEEDLLAERAAHEETTEQLQLYKEDNHRLEAEKAALEARIDEALASVDEAEKVQSSAQVQLVDEKRVAAEVSEELDALRHAMHDLNLAKEALESSLEEAKQNAKVLTEERDEILEKLNEWEGRGRNWTRQRDGLEADSRSFQERERKWKEQIDKLMAEIEALKQELASLRAEKKELERLLEEKQEEASRLQQERDELEADARSKAEEIAELTERIAEAKAEIQSLENGKREVNRMLDETAEQLRAQEDETSRWKQQCDTLQSDVRSKTDEIAELTNRNAEAKAEIQSLEDSKKEIHRMFTETAARLSEQEDETSRWKQRCDDLESDIRSKSSEIEELKAKQSELTDLNDKVSADARAQEDRLQRALDETAAQLSGQENETSRWKQRCDDLESDVRDKSAAIEELKAKQAELMELNDKVNADARAEEDRLQSALDETAAQLSRLQQQCDTLEADVRAKRDENTELRSEGAQLSGLYDRVKAGAKAQEDRLQRALDETAALLKAKQDEASRLQRRCDALDSETHDKSGEVGALKAKLSELMDLNDQLRADAQAQEERLQRALNDTTAQLKAQEDEANSWKDRCEALEAAVRSKTDAVDALKANKVELEDLNDELKADAQAQEERLQTALNDTSAQLKAREDELNRWKDQYDALEADARSKSDAFDALTAKHSELVEINDKANTEAREANAQLERLRAMTDEEGTARHTAFAAAAAQKDEVALRLLCELEQSNRLLVEARWQTQVLTGSLELSGASVKHAVFMWGDVILQDLDMTDSLPRSFGDGLALQAKGYAPPHDALDRSQLLVEDLAGAVVIARDTPGVVYEKCEAIEHSAELLAAKEREAVKAACAHLAELEWAARRSLERDADKTLAEGALRCLEALTLVEEASEADFSEKKVQFVTPAEEIETVDDTDRDDEEDEGDASGRFSSPAAPKATKPPALDWNRDDDVPDTPPEHSVAWSPETFGALASGGVLEVVCSSPDTFVNRRSSLKKPSWQHPAATAALAAVQIIATQHDTARIRRKVIALQEELARERLEREEERDFFVQFGCPQRRLADVHAAELRHAKEKNGRVAALTDERDKYKGMVAVMEDKANGAIRGMMQRAAEALFSEEAATRRAHFASWMAAEHALRFDVITRRLLVENHALRHRNATLRRRFVEVFLQDEATSRRCTGLEEENSRLLILHNRQTFDLNKYSLMYASCKTALDSLKKRRAEDKKYIDELEYEVKCCKKQYATTWGSEGILSSGSLEPVDRRPDIHIEMNQRRIRELIGREEATRWDLEQLWWQTCANLDTMFTARSFRDIDGRYKQSSSPRSQRSRTPRQHSIPSRRTTSPRLNMVNMLVNPPWVPAPCRSSSPVAAPGDSRKASPSSRPGTPPACSPRSPRSPRNSMALLPPPARLD
ncbi:hypothetical protein DIPPA_17901 [Diplonema papillatum]|nr:hypothetical protein DIPPA_17901 [Diplonema papillatum]